MNVFKHLSVKELLVKLTPVLQYLIPKRGVTLHMQCHVTLHMQSCDHTHAVSCAQLKIKLCTP